jgi:hypothetical protein
MNQWEPKPAVRVDVPLSVGLEGPPGGGKSVSALLLAQGMAEVRGGPIIVIDTEHRAHKYAGVQIEDPQTGRPLGRPLEFHVVRFDPPFRADRYLEAIKAQIPRNPACIVVDSMSDEHNGPGGRLDWHEEELDRILRRYNPSPDYDPRRDYPAREKNALSAWRPSSEARDQLASAINRIGPTPLILTFRAEEKTKPVEQIKNGRKVQVPTNIGYTPIAPAKIVHALDIVCLLPVRADGVPMWRSDKAHQDFVLKLPQQFRGMLTDGARITPEIGAALARWAKGDAAAVEVQAEIKRAEAEQGTLAEVAHRYHTDADVFPGDRPSRQPAEPPKRGLFATAIERSQRGYAEWREFWDHLTDEQRDKITEKFGDGLLEDSKQVDAQRQREEAT